MTELKPCPFCGGKVRIFHIEHIDLRERRFDFNCTRCDAYFSLTARSKYVSAEATEAEAIEVFNQRHSRKATRGEQETLIEQHKQCKKGGS